MLGLPVDAPNDVALTAVRVDGLPERESASDQADDTAVGG
jgi:hypothetical protein